MKAAIITCNNADNYGARLQTYALARFINDNGHRAEVIDYEPGYMTFSINKVYNPGLNVKEWAKLFLQYRLRKDFIDKHLKLEEFSSRHIPLTHSRYHNVAELNHTPPEADIYIAGSDQIWNTLFPNGHDPAFYLNFGPETTRRISYAASFATDSISPRHMPRVKEMLAKIDDISVRESSAIDILATFGKKAVQVCDPAFLLTRQQWDEIATAPSESEPYILVYDFERSKAVEKVARRLAAAERLKICSASPWRLGWADRNFQSCSPEEFLGLIKNARCVVSNSLHGSIFSMIYGVDFLVVNRGDGLNVRMSDITRRYGLLPRIVTPDSPIRNLQAKIDYTKVLPELHADIDTSKAWLLRQLDFTFNK